MLCCVSAVEKGPFVVGLSGGVELVCVCVTCRPFLSERRSMCLTSSSIAW